MQSYNGVYLGWTPDDTTKHDGTIGTTMATLNADTGKKAST